MIAPSPSISAVFLGVVPRRIAMENETEERRRLRLSGKATAFGLVMAVLITGVLIPAVLKLPTWIDYDIVLVV